MAVYRLQLVACLITACFAGAGAAQPPQTPNLAVASTEHSQPGSTVTTPQDAGAKTTPFSDEKQTSKTLFSTGANDPNFSPLQNTSQTREMFFKMMASLLIVVALGAAVIYASKKLVGRISNLPGRKIKIVETAHLGPRKAVHLLRIGDRSILIGSTNESITKLADLTAEVIINTRAFGEDPTAEGSHEFATAAAFGLQVEPADHPENMADKYTES